MEIWPFPNKTFKQDLNNYVDTKNILKYKCDIVQLKSVI